jgi:MoxR-like ATPase
MTRAGRMNALIDALCAGLVERRRHMRLALLAALAGEHTLLIGPPGTAKSELSRRLHTAFRDARYFERLLTRFSVPEELFGPLSIRALEEDRYERQTAGFLPEASIAFIDEVFKANSAILNALLTLLNEREFDNGAGRQRCPLISVIGATNAVPEDEVGEAFFDRFLMRLPVAPVSAAGFEALLKVSRGDTPIRPELALDDHDLAALAEAAGRVDLPASVTALLAELRRHCAEQQIIVSDRRWVKIVRLLRVARAKVPDHAARDQRLHDGIRTARRQPGRRRQAHLRAAPGMLARGDQLELARALGLDPLDEQIGQLQRLGTQRGHAAQAGGGVEHVHSGVKSNGAACPHQPASGCQQRATWRGCTHTKAGEPGPPLKYL